MPGSLVSFERKAEAGVERHRPLVFLGHVERDLAAAALPTLADRVLHDRPIFDLDLRKQDGVIDPTARDDGSRGQDRIDENAFRTGTAWNRPRRRILSLVGVDLPIGLIEIGLSA